MEPTIPPTFTSPDISAALKDLRTCPGIIMSSLLKSSSCDISLYNSHIIEDNFANDKLVCYYNNINEAITVPVDCGLLILANTSNIIVENLEIKNTKLHSNITDEKLLDLYQESDAFVLPSLLDGWGLTATEAMACGIPVVVSDLTGMKDIIEDEENGIIVRHKNWKDIYNSLEKLITDVDYRNKLSKNARATTEQNSWTKHGGELINYLKKI